MSVSQGYGSPKSNCHWVLDVVLAKDSYRIRQGNEVPNLVILRPTTLNLLRRKKPVKVSIPNQRLLVAYDEEYLLIVLSTSVCLMATAMMISFKPVAY